MPTKYSTGRMRNLMSNNKNQSKRLKRLLHNKYNRNQNCKKRHIQFNRHNQSRFSKICLMNNSNTNQEVSQIHGKSSKLKLNLIKEKKSLNPDFSVKLVDFSARYQKTQINLKIIKDLIHHISFKKIEKCQVFKSAITLSQRVWGTYLQLIRPL